MYICKYVNMYICKNVFSSCGLKYHSGQLSIATSKRNYDFSRAVEDFQKQGTLSR